MSNQLNDIASELIIIPKSTLDQLLKTNNPSDCIALYTFYYYTAKWQGTNQPKCTTNYSSTGLNISKDRIRRAKKELIELELIEDIVGRKKDSSKFNEWYIKVNFIFKKKTVDKLHPTDFPESGKTHSVENQDTNALSTNSINALSTNKESIGKPNGFQLGTPKININSEVLSILNTLKDLGEFKTKIEPTNPSKTVQRIVKYITGIKSGQFTRDIKLDPVWQKKFIKDFPNINGYESWVKVKRLLINSLKNMIQDKQSNKEAGGSLWFPDDMEKFFFNAKYNQPGKSMFLKYMNNSATTPEENTIKWQKGKLPKEVQDDFEKFINEYTKFKDNGRLQFWSNMNSLQTYYKKNYEKLVKYNEAYNDNGFGYHCGSIERFFSFVLDYLKNECGGYIKTRPIPLDYENTYWRNFRAYMLNARGIELQMDSEKFKQIGEIMAEKERRKFDEKVNKEVRTIERICKEENIEVPELDELFRMAEENVKKEEKLLEKN
jgi:hypothetical protein